MTRSAEIWVGRVRAAFTGAIREDVVVDEGFGPVQVDVPAERWVDALRLARDELDCTFLDFLSAVDELQDGFRVVCHLADHHPRGVAHLVVRTLLPREAPWLPSVVDVFAGARWHERETHEMFGIDFTDGPGGEVLTLEKLLLPEEFEGHPLRKEFVLASRVAKPWPGAKEPGEGEDTAHASSASSRRRTKPPGVPEPEQWGPRDPASEAPDPLGAATAAPAARPRRERKATAPSAGRDRTAGGAAIAQEATDLSKATDPDDQAGRGTADG
jgi:NADH-quinone oxidoreductase subunit C